MVQNRYRVEHRVSLRQAVIFANPVQELQWQPSPPAWVPLANLVTGLGVDEYFTRTPAGLGQQTLLTDALGSTVELRDASGGILNQYTYEPFGNTSVTGSMFNPYQYTGRGNDGTGLYFYRARYYNPAVQRFISEDPIGFKGGINPYSYVGNNPLNFKDPSGNQVQALPWLERYGPEALDEILAAAAAALAAVWAAAQWAKWNLTHARPRPVDRPKPKEKCEKLAKCDPYRYDKQLGGCVYYCDDGMWWFEIGPCRGPIYKPWGDGIPGGPPIPIAP